ncbi:hypothetical protein GTH52_05295 [Clostridium tyrobutyricum]|jgi:uncharacterized protein YuzB (UPF0349 family)|uniref:DUF1450 domain-containing protein n=1 Tax=Clostridium tyrobutyricum DIVETGP TaxID=1408889 RepID=W6N8B0_CLOTY|nr:hypothetical protein [Clostridium tyrobutyricum]AND84712.1 hypothetical protein CTK_C14510 [Clostridium tyrobutyricum]ANP69307.1 hypothetical protein BA182_06365 [Clostridium tyrobutyricum]MBR9648378.1 hypothetical protein [Clostridium tyrobutyricum]MBV4417336.1 hypothetical protein [Clostridium tyrobutyricum]MBV4423081.1 hypothetical protein [Clostridium tyrobutyricum]
MSKIKVCKNAVNYDGIIKALKDNKIDYKVKHCIHKCSKCHKKVLIKKDNKYISAKSVERLIEKL